VGWLFLVKLENALLKKIKKHTKNILETWMDFYKSCLNFLSVELSYECINKYFRTQKIVFFKQNWTMANQLIYFLTRTRATFYWALPSIFSICYYHNPSLQCRKIKMSMLKSQYDQKK